MMKHWQQIEQEAKDKIARYHYERAGARRSQQMIIRYFKAVTRAIRRTVSGGETVLELESVPVRVK